MHLLLSDEDALKFENNPRGTSPYQKTNSLFARLISHQPAVLFSQNEPATSNQPQPASSTLLSEQTSTSHQPPANRTGCKLVVYPSTDSNQITTGALSLQTNCLWCLLFLWKVQQQKPLQETAKVKLKQHVPTRFSLGH
jgi:hypothetical protein